MDEESNWEEGKESRGLIVAVTEPLEAITTNKEELFTGLRNVMKFMPESLACASEASAFSDVSPKDDYWSNTPDQGVSRILVYQSRCCFTKSYHHRLEMWYFLLQKDYHSKAGQTLLGMRLPD